MFRLTKYRSRRVEIRKNRPEAGSFWRTLRQPRVTASLLVAVTFWLVASAVTLLRDQMVRYRQDQYAAQAVLSRVGFDYSDPDRVTEIRQRARESASRVYRATANTFVEL